MKKSIKKIIIFIILISCTISHNFVYARFADYSDEDAKIETEKILQEQKQNYNVIKSSNNYLKNLKVKDYEIVPNFDKQIINYEIKEEVTADEIQIQAEKDDEKASISGDGNITLNSGENNITIDVIAENGTVRSYYIKVAKVLKKELRLNSLNLDAISNEKNINTIKLEPDFNSEVFTYNCNVANYIDKIKVNAKSNIENANIEISGNENLKEGLNEILVTVKNSNNEKTVYKIYVNKEKIEVNELNKNDKSSSSVTIIITVVVICLFLILIVCILKKNRNI